MIEFIVKLITSNLRYKILNFQNKNLETFKALDKEENNKINYKDFYEFYQETWKSAFRLLGEQVTKGPNVHKVS